MFRNKDEQIVLKIINCIESKNWIKIEVGLLMKLLKHETFKARSISRAQILEIIFSACSLHKGKSVTTVKLAKPI
jgi:hypothetical protein